jgi:tetrahydromethanopterin S-methyltransferase subunit G
MPNGYDDCPKGINNAKDIERLGERVALMFDHLSEGLDKLDKKLDQLDKKIEDLKESIPKQIDAAVEAKWKTGVYGVVKWLVIAVVTAIIGVTVRMIMGG